MGISYLRSSMRSTTHAAVQLMDTICPQGASCIGDQIVCRPALHELTPHSVKV